MYASFKTQEYSNGHLREDYYYDVYWYCINFFGSNKKRLSSSLRLRENSLSEFFLVLVLVNQPFTVFHNFFLVFNGPSRTEEDWRSLSISVEKEKKNRIQGKHLSQHANFGISFSMALVNQPVNNHRQSIDTARPHPAHQTKTPRKRINTVQY